MEILSELFKTAFPIVITSLCTYIVWFLQQDRKIRYANCQGTKEILGYMIDRLYDEVQIQGYITTDQSDLLESVFKSYTDLFGNGTRKHKYDGMKRMQIDDSRGSFSPFSVLYKRMLEDGRQ